MGDGCKQKLCIQNCGQTAADEDMFTKPLIDSLKLIIVLSNGTIADPLRRTVQPQNMRYKQQTTTNDMS